MYLVKGSNGHLAMTAAYKNGFFIDSLLKIRKLLIP
jgi:hypothetical protein